ncbi:MAG: hypothetical protein AWU57_2011 [Marinobacter sp. T13-3]|jgi:uncharacterized membrane protein|nr:MAG: hypothetical protein AWU57_2011 [Marinobacter sp. T13-3]
MQWLPRIAIGLLSVGYPVAVYLTLQHAGTSAAVWLLVPIGILHGVRALRGQRSGWWWLTACVALTAWSWFQQSVVGVKFYPVVMSVGLLAVFIWSLVFPPTVIERLARLKEPDLPPSGVAYTRQVTWLWCGFFLINAMIASATVYAQDWVWTLYNGFISYLLMGLLFVGEWLFRHYYRSQHDD